MSSSNGRNHRGDDSDRTREHGEEWRADDWRNNAAERGDAQRRAIERPHDRGVPDANRARTGFPSGYGYNDGDYDRDYTRGRTVPYSHVRGPHHGKGPRGFQRSDERIRELVNEALTDHDDLDATEIVVEVNAGEVTLSGMVEDRRMKRLAEDCVERISGVRDVHNQLRIARTPARPDAVRG